MSIWHVRTESAFGTTYVEADFVVANGEELYFEDLEGNEVARFKTYNWYKKAPVPEVEPADPREVDRLTTGIKFQLGALWLGAHYSKHNRRWCINLIPFLTLWVALKGGKRP